MFDFEEGKSGTPHFLHLRVNGCPLDFHGKVTFAETWVAIEGVLRKSYDEKTLVPVRLYKKLDPSDIDWSHYGFTLTEARSADRLILQHLKIHDWQEAAFPKEILAFCKLKSLQIVADRHRPERSVSALTEISPELAQLSELEELHIANTSITELPDCFESLTKLHQVFVLNNQLTTLPASLLRLPELKFLYAGRNQLNQLPEDVDLPKLERFAFEHNRLTTLPQALVTQPSLRSADLSHNPWQSLPAGTDAIADITLDIEDKRRLFDYRYRNADGKVVEAADESLFLAAEDENSAATLAKAIKGSALEKHHHALSQLALRSVCLATTKPDKYATLGNTRIGGLPDLPAGMTYPTLEDNTGQHLIFIGQLNCSELTPLQEYLPREGMLYFFIEDEESFACRVIYHPENTDLVSASELEDITLNLSDLDEPYRPFQVEASPMVSLPAFYADDYWYSLVDAPELANLQDYDHDDYESYSEQNQRDEVAKKLGKKGITAEWNKTFYADAHHSINDYVFTQHESPQEQAALKFKGNPEDWMVLLKVHSDNNCGFNFWDAGELFFVIHKSDLAKADFRNVYASIESS